MILEEIARFELQEVRSSDQTDFPRFTEIHGAILAPSVPKVAETERNPLESKGFTEFFPRRSQPTTSGHVSQTDPLWPAVGYILGPFGPDTDLRVVLQLVKGTGW